MKYYSFIKKQSLPAEKNWSNIQHVKKYLNGFLALVWNLVKRFFFNDKSGIEQLHIQSSIEWGWRDRPQKGKVSD